ncbi:Regulator of telomere elongation helicase [Brachionus plicatilis]|uniref:Regulator of telomere elongation helicase 1 homolog n=1 Tax=Brachionus plicatilis TaxID=10195 RepID=A0A3M7RIU9_BRAPC|nr:Regulator of telomere elongation helicase [Brachionus plicatilis]
MPGLELNGIEVNFPFVPYPCQVDYMTSVLESIIKKKNAILESPTGTGKTLCLLCSSISWLISAKADMQFATVQRELDDIDPIRPNLINKSGINDQIDNNKKLAYPKIIYASRTHSQLTQVIKELKMTQYKDIKTCAIGSRDQLCINPQVNQQKNYTTKLNMCKAKVNAKTCFFYNNVENVIPELKALTTVDIEDLNAFGNKHKCCPYYTARNLKEGADILFMPYNYLLDKKLRKSNNIDMNNTVVIFDEAHNVERVCEDSASAEFSTTDIASAMSEIDFLLDEIQKIPDEDSNFREDDPNDLENLGNAMANMPATLEELKDILLILKSLEEELDSIKIQGQDGITKTAVFLFELLKKCNINFDRRGYIFDILQRLLQYFGAQTPSAKHHNGASLGKFQDFMQTIFSDNTVSDDGSGDINKKIKKISQFYKVYIKNDNLKGRIICFWCLCPGYSMQDLLSEGARCIILTSGTLSPISTFKDEMKIPFDVVLENPHIIKESQIKVLSVNKGPDNVVLSSKYTNRDSENYIKSLGETIQSFCKIVPHGVLVFFPSYRALESALNSWRKSNLWNKIGDVKSIFIESKNSKDCNDTVLKYYEKIKDRRSNGAIMFAVCRGKISEGIDFNDNNGRAVIVTGLPFPLYTDPRVVLKRQYLDEHKTSSGTLWYNQQTYRAVNQAIGRVIRHKNDYGAILLCDERFSQMSSISQLPGWMRGHMKKINEYNSALDELGKFFNVAVEKYPIVPKIPSLQSNVSYVQAEGQMKHKEQGGDMMVDICSAYGSQKPAIQANTDSVESKNFYDALGQSKSAMTNLEPFNCGTNRMDNDENNFKLILQKRKMEEAKNGKCRVVIKDTVSVTETKTEKLNDSIFKEKQADTEKKTTNLKQFLLIKIFL